MTGGARYTEAVAGQRSEPGSWLVEVGGAREPPELESGAHVTVVAGNEKPARAPNREPGWVGLGGGALRS